MAELLPIKLKALFNQSLYHIIQSLNYEWMTCDCSVYMYIFIYKLTLSLKINIAHTLSI